MQFWLSNLELDLVLKKSQVSGGVGVMMLTRNFSFCLFFLLRVSPDSKKKCSSISRISLEAGGISCQAHVTALVKWLHKSILQQVHLTAQECHMLQLLKITASTKEFKIK